MKTFLKELACAHMHAILSLKVMLPSFPNMIVLVSIIAYTIAS